MCFKSETANGLYNCLQLSLIDLCMSTVVSSRGSLRGSTVVELCSSPIKRGFEGVNSSPIKRGFEGVNSSPIKGGSEGVNSSPIKGGFEGVDSSPIKGEC